MKNLQFKTNITCGGCIKTVTPFLNALTEIVHWEVDTNDPSKILTVYGESPTPDMIIRKVKEAGYEIEELTQS